MLNQSDENYLRALWMHHEAPLSFRVTQAILARQHKHSGPAAHKIVHKLIAKGLIITGQDGSIQLSKSGLEHGALIVRKHRLWEVFLVEKLGFDWGSVHDLAGSLEHIGDADFINRLESYLNSPRFDPHGDPIPDRDGKIERSIFYPLSEWPLHENCSIIGVREQSQSFLDWMLATGLVLGTRLIIKQKLLFDGSIIVDILDKNNLLKDKATLSPFAADHILVEE